MNTISFIIPSMNRSSLHKTIASIEAMEGDEILVEFDLPPTGGWGNEQRNAAILRASGKYLAFIDDDDAYVKGHRAIMGKAMRDNPGYPNLFRIQYPNGRKLWERRELTPGNISTQMILIPNDREMFDWWKPRRNMADYLFVESWKWPEIIWREEIICQMGHDDDDNIAKREVSKSSPY